MEKDFLIDIFSQSYTAKKPKHHLHESKERVMREHGEME